MALAYAKRLVKRAKHEETMAFRDGKTKENDFKWQINFLEEKLRKLTDFYNDFLIDG